MLDGVGSAQATNGYAYVHNNPLTYTDPSGWCGSLTCKHRNDGVRPEADTDGEYGGGSGAAGPSTRRSHGGAISAFHASRGISTAYCYGDCLSGAGYLNVRDPRPDGGWHDFPVSGAVTGVNADGNVEGVLVQSKRSVWIGFANVTAVGSLGTVGASASASPIAPRDWPPDPAMSASDTAKSHLMSAESMVFLLEKSAKFDGMKSLSHTLTRLGTGLGLVSAAASIAEGDFVDGTIVGAFAIATASAAFFGFPTVALVTGTGGLVYGIGSVLIGNGAVGN
jgi:hypothetical protein